MYYLLQRKEQLREEQTQFSLNVWIIGGRFIVIFVAVPPGASRDSSSYLVEGRLSTYKGGAY